MHLSSHPRPSEGPTRVDDRTISLTREKLNREFVRLSDGIGLVQPLRPSRQLWQRWDRWQVGHIVQGIRCTLCEMHTDRYEEGVEDGELPESQHGAIGWRD